ncbi:hypothetical protein [Actinomyces succiniciruminis]|uniref:hypothetical protein n=1 Tax=Actinomyces succiniciruminis TaxID=1522002 RepID=UPI001B336CD9|nr:hypothetical protein [Actinomyces succiniciruminis]
MLAGSALIAADDGVLRVEVVAGRYGLRLTVGAAVSVGAVVVLEDGLTYDLSALLGLAPDGGGVSDAGGDATPVVTVAADGLRLLVPEHMVSGDGLTYTMTDADAEGVGLIMIGD